MQQKPDSEMPSVGELATYVTFRMSRTLNKLNAQTTFFLKDRSDITLVEWRVLRLLAALGDTTMTRIAAEMRADKGQLSRKIKTMLGRGLIVSAPDHNDSRQQVLGISDKGQATLNILMPLLEQRQRLLTKDISAAELQSFFDVLEKIDDAAGTRELP